MNDNFLNKTGLQYYHNRIKTEFASQDDLDTLDNKVDQIIAEGGEPNVIEVVKVNGTALTPVNKAVDVTVPTDLSDLTNTAQDPYATESYVDQNGGKIDTISVNGTQQTITNKNVDITVPTDLSDLTNTGNDPYATESYVDQNGGKIDVIKVNGTAQTITNKEVDLTVPTKVSDLTNDSNFIDNTVNNLTNYYTKSETYTQTEVDNLIGAISSLDIQVVQTLPTQDISTTTIYLVPKSTAQTNNAYDEYVYSNNAWELIGDTQLDLSNYWNNTNLVAITTAEIDTIVGGTPSL